MRPKTEREVVSEMYLKVLWRAVARGLIPTFSLVNNEVPEGFEPLVIPMVGGTGVHSIILGLEKYGSEGRKALWVDFGSEADEKLIFHDRMVSDRHDLLFGEPDEVTLDLFSSIDPQKIDLERMQAGNNWRGVAVAALLGMAFEERGRSRKKK